MRIILLSTLFPSAARPSHGIFVENRMRALIARGHEVRVIAPVPRFPLKDDRFGDYARFARTPLNETRNGVPVSHPRYTLVPKVGMTAAVTTLTQCFTDAIARAMEEGFIPDLVDAHYYYPDGVAAVRAAEAFHLPVVVTARGTDINLIPNYPRQKAMIVDAAKAANGSITVAEALRTEMIALGMDGDAITTIRNGVDLSRFVPGDQPALKRSLGIDGPVIASVGHLVERKGHHLVIEALQQIEGAHLVIAGRGQEEDALKAQAETAGLSERVIFLGEVSHDDLKNVYGAADVLCLASSREGWPNVLLEALACGTPCVATPVWGSGEVLSAEVSGRLTTERTAEAIAAALQEQLAQPSDRDAVRQFAEQFSWAPVAEAVEKVWVKAVAEHESQGWGRAVPLPPRSTRRRQRQAIRPCSRWIQKKSLTGTAISMAGTRRH